MLMCSYRAYVKSYEGHVNNISYFVIQRFIRPKKVLTHCFCLTFSVYMYNVVK
jgi:hypothetical protein